jgi:hypothetical protein
LDLLWYVIRPYGRGITNYERPSEYRAPTWSWASVDGEIRTLNKSYNLTSYENDDRMDNLEPAFEVVNVQVTTSELDPAKTGRSWLHHLLFMGPLEGHHPRRHDSNRGKLKMIMAAFAFPSGMMTVVIAWIFTLIQK